MCFHRKALALDKVLTWMMEVELFQRVAAVAKAERVTFGEVKLNGVAVVDDLIWPFDPTDLEWWLLRGDGASDIDG